MNRIDITITVSVVVAAITGAAMVASMLPTQTKQKDREKVEEMELLKVHTPYWTYIVTEEKIGNVDCLLFTHHKMDDQLAVSCNWPTETKR